MKPSAMNVHQALVVWFQVYSGLKEIGSIDILKEFYWEALFLEQFLLFSAPKL